MITTLTFLVKILLFATLVSGNSQSTPFFQICSYDSLLGYSTCTDTIGVPYISGTINTNVGRTLNLIDSSAFQTFYEQEGGNVVACYQNNVLSQFCLDNLNSTTVKFGGSEEFCDSYKCKGNPVCYCKIGVANETFTNSAFSSFLPSEETSGLISTGLNTDSLLLLDYLTLPIDSFIEQNFILPLFSMKREIISNYPVFVSFESPVFSFVFGDNQPKLITVFGETFSNTIETNNTFTSLVLNVSDSSISQRVEITVQTLSIPSTVLFQTSFDMIGLRTCILPDCTFCYQALDAFDCSPSGYKAWIVVSWSLVIILVGGWLLVFYIWGFSVAFWFILKPIRIIWNMMPTMRKKKFYLKAKRFGSNFYDNWFKNEDDTVNADEIKKIVSKNTIENRKMEETIKENKLLKNENKHKRMNDEGVEIFKENFGTDMSKKEAREILDDIDDYEIPTRDVKKIKKARLSILQMFVLLNFMILICNCCSSSQIISSTLTNCQQGSGSVNCQLQYDSQIILRSIGDSICLNFNTTDQGVVKFMNITYIRAIDEYVTGTGYYTADWTGKTQSNFRCFGAGRCTISDCNKINMQNIRLANGELSSPYLSAWPGVTECTRACSSLICGCLLDQPGCIFSGYSIAPFGTIYRYRPFTTRIINPIIQICDENVCLRHELGDGVANFKEVRVTIDGTLDATNYIYPFTGKTGVLAGNVSRIVLASGINTPTAGLVGDIQATDTRTFQSGGQNSFIYDPSVITSQIPVTKSMQYTFRQSGVSLLTPQNSILLPFNSPKGLYTLNSDGITGTLNQGPALVLNMVSTSQVVSVSTNVVCPTCEFVGLYGCYNCSYGAWIAFKSKSTCLDGNANLISSLHLNQLIINLDTTLKTYNISFYSNSSIVDSIIRIEGTTQNCIVEVKGNLHADTPILTNQTTNSTNPINSDSSDGWWQGKPYQWFIVVGLPIIAGVILISLLIISLLVFLVVIKKLWPVIKNFAAHYGISSGSKDKLS